MADESKHPMAGLLAEMSRLMKEINNRKAELVQSSLNNDVCPECGFNPKESKWRIVIPYDRSLSVKETLYCCCSHGHEWESKIINWTEENEEKRRCRDSEKSPSK